MEEGLKLTVEEMKCVETTAYIPCEMFSSYTVKANEDIKFKLSLKVLTECLHIFGDDGNPSLKLSYSDTGSPLCLVYVKIYCEVISIYTIYDIMH